MVRGCCRQEADQYIKSAVSSHIQMHQYSYVTWVETKSLMRVWLCCCPPWASCVRFTTVFVLFVAAFDPCLHRSDSTQLKPQTTCDASGAAFFSGDDASSAGQCWLNSELLYTEMSLI